MISLLDTNVIIRFFTADRSAKYKNLYPFFQSLEKGEMRVELKLIVLFQVVFVLKSFYKVPREDIAQGLLALLQYKGIIIKEKGIVLRTLDLWQTKTIDIVDCYLISCLESDSQNFIYSYDGDFEKFNIKRVEP